MMTRGIEAGSQTVLMIKFNDEGENNSLMKHVPNPELGNEMTFLLNVNMDRNIAWNEIMTRLLQAVEYILFM